MALLEAVARLAEEDCGVGTTVLTKLDSIAVVRFFSDTIPAFASPFGRVVNPPWSLGHRIGANAADLVYAPQGGDTPQTLVARACDRISSGESEVALVIGAEAMRTQLGAARAGLVLDWSEDAPEAPNELGGVSQLYSEGEVRHGMRSAVAMYAFFEQALRRKQRTTLERRRETLGRLFESFSAVAQQNPYATRRQTYSAEEITHVGPLNALVGFPYTRLMTASVNVDQAAGIILTSDRNADEWGVPRDRRVYPLAASAAHDTWFASERKDMTTSPAVAAVVADVLAQAGIALADVDMFDIYSCFGSAVEVACDAIGLDLDDPRGLTVTGGLPFFGGPGNNYVTHAIAEMVSRIRRTPDACGLVTANGGLLTKHAAGLYGSKPPVEAWATGRAVGIQRRIDAMPTVPIVEHPTGRGTIETCTVLHDRAGPRSGLIVGQSDGGGRFLAVTPSEPDILLRLQGDDVFDIAGLVEQGPDGRNVFRLA